MSEAAKHRGRSQPDACSIVWDTQNGSVLGTAPAATFWVALEQNGPWGAQAATESHFDPDLGATLSRGCQDASGRFLLIRRAGAHSDLRDGQPRRIYLAGGLAGRPWLLEGDLDEPARLARLPWDALISGDRQAVQNALPEVRASPAPVLMICTNSRRDVCCSVRGRPVAIESATQRPGQVWECSHIGGHRFAPTGVLLPYGQTFGRLSGASAIAAVDAAQRGQMTTDLMGGRFDRGRTHLPAPGQAAESIVRQQILEPGLLALSTTASPLEGRENTWRCRVRHVDGRQWDVVAIRGHGADLRPESCGREPVPSWQWSVAEDLEG